MQHSSLSVEFVTMFFLLSGFSIAHSLNNEHKVSAFYGRRLIRLYPPYIMGIVWALAVFLIIKETASDVFMKSIEGHVPLDYEYSKFGSLKVIIANLLYVPTENYLTPQYWSLPFEVIFYLTIPWLVKKVNPYILLTVAIFIWGCYKYGVYILDTDNPLNFTIFSHTIFSFYIPQYLIDFNIFFLIGFLFYKYKDRILDNFKLNKWLCFLLLLGLFEAMVVLKAYYFHNDPNKVTSFIMVLFTFITIFASLKYQVHIKPLEWVGKFSYTLYVTHVASIFLVKLISYKLGFHFYDIYNPYDWCFGIIVAVLFAWLLYYVAEYPTMNYLKKIRAKNTQREQVRQLATVPVMNEQPNMDMQKTGDH